MSGIPRSVRTYIRGLENHDLSSVASAVSEELVFVLPDRMLTKPQFLDMLQALYAAFPNWQYAHRPPEWIEGALAIKWRQWGTHTNPFVIPGIDPIEATGRKVAIPEQYFFYRVQDEQIWEIRPDPVPGGAPRGILEQIGGSGSAL